jgi:ABC-type dipeptide/oligopeptide/nickel transport system permease component
MLGVSLPNFVMAILLITVFVLGLKLIPYTEAGNNPPTGSCRP